MPSRIWYALAIIVFVATGAMSTYRLIDQTGDMGQGLVRVVVPGQVDITLGEAGLYTIFHETSSVVDGRYYEAATIEGLTISVNDAASGVDVPLVVPSGSSSYSFGQASGHSVMEFTIAAPGRYRLAARYEDGAGPRTVLAVGRRVVERAIGGVFRTMSLVLVGTGIAIGIAALTFIRRRKAGAAW